MIKRILPGALLFGIMVTLISFDLPEGWGQAGSKPNSYKMGIAKGAGHDGKNAATIKSIEKDIDGFGTLMQSSSPEEYLGRRVKMSGYVKSENVTKWAGLWLRVDQTGSNQALSFDNMHNRSIKGTTGWKKYEVVLDVPENASNLAYGALLNGTGQIWFDNLTFEIVDNSVKTTGMINNGKSASPNKPTNLDFEN